VLLQPYEDGVTTRRGSIIAALALGVPVVTTTGRMTEPLWRASAAVTLVADGDSKRWQWLLKPSLSTSRGGLRCRSARANSMQRRLRWNIPLPHSGSAQRKKGS